jgi:hypothetical protein
VPEVSASSPSGRWTRRNPRRRASRRSPGLPGASRGPLGASVNSAIDVKGEIAAIELADVSGPQRSPGFGSTLEATSYGVGSSSGRLSSLIAVGSSSP